MPIAKKDTKTTPKVTSRRTTQKVTLSEVKKPEIEKVSNPDQKSQIVMVRFLDKNVKISPRKLRLCANVAKKLSPQQAISNLNFTNSKSARILLKSIKKCLANAKNKNMDLDNLAFESIIVGDSIKLKRMDKSHGSRFNRGIIQKRHSRLEIKIKQQQNGSKS